MSRCHRQRLVSSGLATRGDRAASIALASPGIPYRLGSSGRCDGTVPSRTSATYSPISIQTRTWARGAALDSSAESFWIVTLRKS